MASDSPPKPKSGLSLYANLLDPSSDTSTSGTISRAPVVFKQPAEDDTPKEEEAAQKQKINAAALRFQPTKRPQIAAQKQANKIAQARAAAINASLSSSGLSQPSLTTPENKEADQRAAPKTTIADWTGDGDDDDVNGFLGGEKRQRGGRKKRKKNKGGEAPVVQNWDDIYDPSRPNNYEEYKHSDEKIREVREWKDRLYAHRMARQKDYSDSDEDDRRPQMRNKFAPPMSFAPPPIDNEPPPPPVEMQDDATGDDAYTRRMQMSQQPYQPPPPPVEVPDDASGEDAYARRMRISQQHSNSSSLSAPQIPPPPPPGTLSSSAARPQPPTNEPPTTIARAPVRYNLPPAPPEIPKSEAELEAALKEEDEKSEEPAEDAPRSLRPGQKGFAERLMGKYGWTKGTGLGANNKGIINPLRVQVEKQKKKSDAEGGGFVGPGGRGKIIGGKKKGGDEEHGKFGPMSDVVILRNMLDGMDLDYEMGEGNLMQEIGEECGEKYGRVERVYVDRHDSASASVFIKFTNQLSALRAVNALENRVFNGNTIVAKFYDSEKFEKGVYS